MRRHVRSRLALLSLGLALVGCKDEPEPAAEPAPEAAPAEPAPAPESDGQDSEGDEDAVVDGEAPTEPSVTMVAPGEGTPLELSPRTPGAAPQRVVVQVRITEGRRRALHLPIVRLAGDVALQSIDDSGSRYQWTPHSTTVLAEGKGVDPEFLAAFESALAVSEGSGPVSLALDRWDVVTELGWSPSGDDPHAAEAVTAQRLALSHLSIPVPARTMAKGATWVVNRRVDLFGIPAWQSLDCTVVKVEGKQFEVSANVRYFGIEGEAPSGKPLGLDSVASLSGRGKLRARFDLHTAVPVDMQLRGRLDVRTSEGAKPRRFGFELRVDEDYLARPDARVSFVGPFVQGGLVRGVVPPDTKVWFNKKKTKVSPEGDFLIGFGRDANPRALVAFSFAGGPTERHIVHVADRTFEPEAIDGLPPEMVDLDREVRKALGKSRMEIKRLRNKSSDTPYFRDGFIWPMKGKITSTYGRKRILNGQDKGPHWGVDLAAPVGKKVKAPAGGVVVLARKDVPLSGNLVILDHGHGLTSSFLHLDKINVKEGDELKKGQVFATSGNSGRSTGPHLDWRMNLFDTRVDPQTLVPPTP